jgi:hypothetical protein
MMLYSIAAIFDESKIAAHGDVSRPRIQKFGPSARTPGTWPGCDSSGIRRSGQGGGPILAAFLGHDLGQKPRGRFIFG